MAIQDAKPPSGDQQRLRMSYEDFLSWATEHRHSEWVDGEVIERERAARRGARPVVPRDGLLD